jgi:hypothetical protein
LNGKAPLETKLDYRPDPNARSARETVSAMTDMETITFSIFPKTGMLALIHSNHPHTRT